MGGGGADKILTSISSATIGRMHRPLPPQLSMLGIRSVSRFICVVEDPVVHITTSRLLLIPLRTMAGASRTLQHRLQPLIPSFSGTPALPNTIKKSVQLQANKSG